MSEQGGPVYPKVDQVEFSLAITTLNSMTNSSSPNCVFLALPGVEVYIPLPSHQAVTTLDVLMSLP